MAAGATSQVLGDQDAELGGGTGAVNSSTPVSWATSGQRGAQHSPLTAGVPRGQEPAWGHLGPRPARGSATEGAAMSEGVVAENQPGSRLVWG